MSIPVAEYLRMSTEDQKYSIPCQQAAIRQYAEKHGMLVCHSYIDPGKSGVLIKHREALAKLLRDVISGEASYKAILVYDISRWGRFQNPDEAAHYDFVCTSAGIPVHYCAEQFSNDGTLQSTLMKAIKRTMAGEFSRELGDKVHAAMKRLVLDGFHAGGETPYGFERMLVSPSGKAKGILKRGVLKNLSTDRVVLVPGKKKEIACVRRIFSMCANEKKTSVQIAAALNSQGITRRGKRWSPDNVLHLIHRREYLGLNVWGRRTLRLHGPNVLQPKSAWVTSKAGFNPIIDQRTFDRAQLAIASHRPGRYTSDALLRKLKRLLLSKGRLSCRLIDGSKFCPYSSKYVQRFGSLLKAYQLVGFQAASSVFTASQHSHSNQNFYRDVVRELQARFPNNLRLVDAYSSRRGVIEVDGQFCVSILMCGKRARAYRSGNFPWVMRVSGRDRTNVKLVCVIDPNWKNIISYYLLPPLDGSVGPSRLFTSDTWLLRSGKRLNSLGDFLHEVRIMSSEVFVLTPYDEVVIPTCT